MSEQKNITGVYRFYIDGKMILEKENAITESGRSIIVKSLLGIIPNFVDSIAYGIGASANSFNSTSTLIIDKSLEFEVGRTKVIGGSLESASTSNQLIFSGEIIDPYQYEIREVAIYPSNNINSAVSLDGNVIFNFDLIDDFVKYGTAVNASATPTSSARIGTSTFSIPINGDSTSNYIEKIVDGGTLSSLIDYSSQDLFKLALFKTSIDAASFYVRFQSDTSNYYDVVFSVPSASGYYICKTTKGSATVTGVPDWQNITSVKFWNPSTSVLNLDALKIDVGSYLTDTNFGMISRAVLPVPVNKPSSVPLVIEYSLLLNFSGGV
jgi:hypothetical protein